MHQRFPIWQIGWMEIYFRISWRRNRSEGGGCDRTTIESGKIIGSGSLVCQQGCSGIISTMKYRCTDFSETENWSYGERRFTYTFGESVDNMRIGYNGTAWIDPFNSPWNIATTMSMRRRNDTGRINSTPRATTSPVVRLQAGCNHTITIPVSDPDGDVMRCRWAAGSECAGICNQFRESVLDPDTCSIYYEAHPRIGYRAVALMIEDFASLNDTAPLSSVALQFLVLLYSSNEPCSRVPEFVYPTYPSGACIAVPPATSFQEDVTASSGGTGVSITEIETVSPAGFRKSALQHTGLSSQYRMRVTWLPEAQQQNQTHGFCLTAVNSIGLSSDQTCIKIMAGYFPPSIVNGSNVPNKQLMHPKNTLFKVKFDRKIQHGTHPSRIIFGDVNTNRTVYEVVVTPASGEVNFVNDTEVEIRPQFRFAEKTSFYITFQAGIVVGTEGCNPWNLEMTDHGFWPFRTRDITPPVINFFPAPYRTNGTAEIAWYVNEETNCSCTLDGEHIQDCFSNSWRGSSLQEGYQKLLVYCKDEANNYKNVSTNFHVDLTPPDVKLSRHPSKQSRDKNGAFLLTCDDPDGCHFFCSVADGIANDTSGITFSPCASSYKTHELRDENWYTFFVYAVDDVLNKGAPLAYQWMVDLTPPSLSHVNDTAIPCGAQSQPENIGIPEAIDNLDPAPTVTYSDSRTSCEVRRTWKAEDEAGNSATRVQLIQFVYRPVISLLPRVSVACDSASGSVNVPESTATAGNACHRSVRLAHIDSVDGPGCPSQLTRTWTLVDQCTQEEVTSSQTINLYDVCPLAACGRNESSPHGICSAGVCNCNQPWYGEQCDSLVYTPVIMNVPQQEIQEGVNYAFVPILQQATPPISWKLVAGPKHSMLDQVTGELTWKRTIAGNYTVIIEVQNEVGKDTASWFLYVKSTYKAYLNVVHTEVYSKAEPIQLDGYVSYDDKSEIRDLLAGYVPVNIDVKCRGTTRTLLTYTKQDGTFATTFYPSSSEYGHYQVGARHPDNPSFDVQAEWKVMGMKCTPSVVRLRDDTLGLYQRTFHNVTNLVNDGPLPMHQVHTIMVPDQFQGELNVSLLFGDSSTLDLVNANASSSISLSVTSAGPFSAVFPIHIQAREMVSSYFTIDLHLNEILPVFVIQPKKIESKLIRGKQRTLELNVTNIGRISATDVKLTSLGSNVIQLSSFGTEIETGNGLTIRSGQSAIAVLTAYVPLSHQLGVLSGTVVITSQQTTKSVPLTLIVSSDLLLDFTVIVEDEYTYFAEGKPLVDDATIRLINYQNNVRLSKSTSEGNGRVTFSSIAEDRYEMYVDAPQHLPLMNVIVTSLDQRTLTIFLERQAVKYTWSVKPVQVEDKYQVTLEADFQANIPMPVVTVTPREVDLEDVILGIVDTIEFNITNHGLIRAENIKFELPTGHSFLDFVLPFDPPEHLDAKSSMIIPVKAVRRARQKRNCQVFFFVANIGYSFICGDRKFRTVAVVFKEKKWLTGGCGGGGGGGGGGVCSGCGFNGYTSFTFKSCNACLSTFLGCLTLPFPSISCITKIFSSKILDTFDLISCYLVQAIPTWPINNCNCFAKLYRDCLVDYGDKRRRKRSTVDTVKAFTEALYPVHLSVLYGVEILGSAKWLKVGDPDWSTKTLKPVFDDNSEMGRAISTAEYEAVMSNPPPRNVNSSDVSQLLQRLNNTLYNWNNGILEPTSDGDNFASFSAAESLKNDCQVYNEKAKVKGFDSFLEAFNFAANDINQVQDWEEGEGVCAVVRIRIEQAIALTREGFLAKLEVENKERTSLEEVEVVISFVNADSGQEATVLFSIGDAVLHGALTGVYGDGSLPSDSSGSAEWLIIPYSEAAPMKDQLYDVGGKLYYTVDGENIIVPLLPSQITVRPDPSLRVHYFWEKNVISDDPFTDEVEPKVPFTLGVAIRNGGYGTAYRFQITSAQPEIIENEKGLLINFAITGVRLGSEPMQPSLSVMFGDIAPNETKVARWVLECSLMGEFKNYNATFENINPLGDPKLSLIDELDIHELIRNVRIFAVDGNEMLTAEVDDVSDFLVNERSDHAATPDSLTSSKTLNTFPVLKGNVTRAENTVIDGARVLLLEVFTNGTGWNYFRSADRLLGLPTTYVGNVAKFTKVNRAGSLIILPPENAWVSTDVLKKTRDRHPHILDYITEDETQRALQYTLWIDETSSGTEATTAAPSEPRHSTATVLDKTAMSTTAAPSEPRHSTATVLDKTAMSTTMAYTNASVEYTDSSQRTVQTTADGRFASTTSRERVTVAHASPLHGYSHSILVFGAFFVLFI